MTPGARTTIHAAFLGYQERLEKQTAEAAEDCG
jgi:hypothetical protein